MDVDAAAVRRVRAALTQLVLPLAPAEPPPVALPPAGPRGRARGDALAVEPPLTGCAPAAPPGVDTASTASFPPLTIVRRRGTRRYILRLLDDGTLRVTVPWWGSQRGARAFVEAERAWVARQLARRAARVPVRWAPGREVLLDGARHALAEVEGVVSLAGQPVASTLESDVIRAGVLRLLRDRARDTLPVELMALAARHGVTVNRVSIRNQSSRWGSCARSGAISLNWRLVQTPPFVREYVLVHELMHRRQMNHSPKFWRLVAEACPRYLEARRWLRVDGAALFEV